MKMSVGTRIVFSLFLIVILGICGLILAASFGAFTTEDILALVRGFTETGFKYIWAAAALLLGIIAICLLFFHSKEAPVNACLLYTSGSENIIWRIYRKFKAISKASCVFGQNGKIEQ